MKGLKNRAFKLSTFRVSTIGKQHQPSGSNCEGNNVGSAIGEGDDDFHSGQLSFLCPPVGEQGTAEIPSGGPGLLPLSRGLQIVLALPQQDSQASTPACLMCGVEPGQLAEREGKVKLGRPVFNKRVIGFHVQEVQLGCGGVHCGGVFERQSFGNVIRPSSRSGEKALRRPGPNEPLPGRPTIVYPPPRIMPMLFCGYS